MVRPEAEWARDEPSPSLCGKTPPRVLPEWLFYRPLTIAVPDSGTWSAFAVPWGSDLVAMGFAGISGTENAF